MAARLTTAGYQPTHGADGQGIGGEERNRRLLVGVEGVPVLRDLDVPAAVPPQPVAEQPVEHHVRPSGAGPCDQMWGAKRDEQRDHGGERAVQLDRIRTPRPWSRLLCCRDRRRRDVALVNAA